MEFRNGNPIPRPMRRRGLKKFQRKVEVPYSVLLQESRLRKLRERPMAEGSQQRAFAKSIKAQNAQQIRQNTTAAVKVIQAEQVD